MTTILQSESRIVSPWTIGGECYSVRLTPGDYGGGHHIRGHTPHNKLSKPSLSIWTNIVTIGPDTHENRVGAEIL